MKKLERPRRRASLRPSTPKPSPAPTAAALAVYEGRVVAVDPEHGVAQVRLADGSSLDARLPQHISAEWLRAAVELAPVDAALARPEAGRALLWSIFPGREHAAVSVDIEISGRHVRLQASERFEIRCSRGTLLIDEKGNVELRGKELLTRASGANRIKGGVIRLN